MNRTILAIDDSLTLREFISRCLSRHSSENRIVLAKDGREGLELARSEKPDLILLDFVLPDMKGDEVCRRLGMDESTASIPIVLMSSSAAEMKRTQALFESVIKSIAKPFTPELLCATVGFGLREIAKRAATAAVESIPAEAEIAAPVAGTEAKTLQTPSGLQMSGNSSQFSIAWVLNAIEQDQLTGVLRVFAGTNPIELFVTGGRPLIVSSRDGEAYLRSGRPAYSFTPDHKKLIEGALKAQTYSGCPVFLSLADQKAMPDAEAARLCHGHGLALFAQTWTAPRTRFEFIAQSTAPHFATRLAPFEGVMGEWAMESLRCVGEECGASMAWGEPTGIPAYTRRGYERIQQIPLNMDELNFAGLIGPTTSLADIAASMRIDTDTAQRILFRFLCLDIFDYWPASLLRAA